MKAQTLATLAVLGTTAAFVPEATQRKKVDVRSLIRRPVPASAIIPTKTSFSPIVRDGTELQALSQGGVAEEKGSLLPSAFFLFSAATLAKLFDDILGHGFTMTTGVWALLLTTAAVGYDNFIIGLGKPFFQEAENDKESAQHKLLKALSFPRFTAHAVLVPFLYTTGAEIGKAMGVEWLQSDLVQTLVVVASAVLAIVSRVRFVNSPGITLDKKEDSPGDSWEQNLIWFTYKEVPGEPFAVFFYIIPSIVLALFNLVVGVAAFNGDFRTAAIWLIASAVAVLYGNSKPSHVTRFTGNLAEVVMLWCIYESAQLVL